MKKYIICLLASASILSAANFTRDDGMIPNLATGPATSDYLIPNLAIAPMSLSAQATAFVGGKLGQYTPENAMYDVDIVRLALDNTAFTDQAKDFVRGKLDLYTPDSPMYDIELVKLAMNSGLRAQATTFVGDKLAAFTPMMYDAEILKLAMGIVN